MFFKVNNANLYAYTGGKAFNPALPTAILIHGVLCDHSVWALQSRYLANHGWNVLAIDLPGHCRSQGAAPTTVEEAATAVAQLMDAAGLEQAALVGHSWGSLIALEAASQLGTRISHLALVGTAFPMKVSPALLESALHTPDKAITLINTFSRATLSPPNGAGSWVFGAGVALGHRVLASNPQANLLHTGFTACDRYANGEHAITQVQCPVLFALGTQDAMTPPKAAQALVQAAQAAGKNTRMVMLATGHNQMSESPDETLFAIHDFLNA